VPDIKNKINQPDKLANPHCALQMSWQHHKEMHVSTAQQWLLL
jgi:hypothetical protein